jgi:8-oxo-dGTP pyrophosphatase MutT (NUDIX family)
MPGAMIALQRDDQHILLTKRTDDESWCLLAGAAEPGGSFARTAIDELTEETGIEVVEADLVPFGCLSEAEAHTIHYPNGDITHCFALLFQQDPTFQPAEVVRFSTGVDIESADSRRYLRFGRAGRCFSRRSSHPNAGGRGAALCFRTLTLSK